MGDPLDKAFIALALVSGAAPSDIRCFPLKPHGFKYLPLAPQVALFERALGTSFAEALPKPAFRGALSSRFYRVPVPRLALALRISC